MSQADTENRGQTEAPNRSVSHPDGIFYLQNFCTPQEGSEFLSSLYKAGAAKSTSLSFRPPEQQTMKWVQLRHRRLMNIGGCPPEVGQAPENGGASASPIRKPKSENLPEWVKALSLPKLQEVELPFVPCFREKEEGTAKRGVPVFMAERPSGDSTISGLPNHVLVNEYKYPEGCILPHEDGPSYEPLVAIVSLQSAVPLVFRPKKKRQRNEGASGAETAEAQTSENRELVDDGAVAVLLEPNSLVVFTNAFYHDYLHEVPARGWNRKQSGPAPTLDLSGQEGADEVDDYLDPRYFLNYDLVRARLEEAEGAENEERLSRGHEENANGVIPLVRGNVRTSVTYRVVPAFQK